MKDKHIEDYISELAVYFPQISEKELTRMVTQMSAQLTYFTKSWYKGFYVGSKDTLVNDGNRYKFEVKRIFGRNHLLTQRERIKNRNKTKDGRE